MTELKASLVLQLKNMLRGGIGQVRGELKGLKSEAQGLGTIKGPNAAGMAAYGAEARRSTIALRELKREQSILGRAGASAGRVAGNTILAGRNRAVAAVGGVYGGYLGTRSTVGEAVAYEKALANIQKKVDFEDVPNGLDGFKRFIDDVARKVPLTRAAIAELAAEMGATGISADQMMRGMGGEGWLMKVAKAAYGYDMDPKEAGEAVAKIRNSNEKLKRDEGQMSDVLDMINYVGDKSAAKEREVIEYSKRAVGPATAMGASIPGTIALGSAAIAGGFQPEVAARFNAAFMAKLLGAEKKSQGKKGKLSEFGEALKELGLTGAEVEKGMETDADKTTLDILSRLAKHKKAGKIAHGLLGQEWFDEGLRLKEMLDDINKFAEDLKDPSKFRGSLDKSFAIDNATTYANYIRAMNEFKEITLDIGQRALPTVNAALNTFRQLLRDGAESDTYFNHLSQSVQGFARGLGYGKESGNPFLDMLRDLVGITKDVAGAGDRLGETFAQWEARGQSFLALLEKIKVALAPLMGGEKKNELAIPADASKESIAEEMRALSGVRNRPEFQTEKHQRFIDKQYRELEQEYVKRGGQPASALRSQLEELRAQQKTMQPSQALQDPKIRSLLQARGADNTPAIEAQRARIAEQIRQIEAELQKLGGEAEKTGAAVKDKLTLDLTPQGAASAMSYARGLLAGVPAVEAAAAALRAPIMTPAAPVPGSIGTRPTNGGGATAPARPTQVTVAGIHIHGVSDPDRAAKRAVSELAQRIRSGNEGAHHDGVT
ncbi:MAG: phage tail tape measure protein [Rhabdaerophilum sp.]